MFLDSEIAKCFTCRSDKTGYILKFGLAPHFKNELIYAVNNAGPFIPMFDEGFNELTKNKLLDAQCSILGDWWCPVVLFWITVHGTFKD